MDIERHEAMAIIDQVLGSDRPLTLLRALAEHGGFKLSPVLQQVSLPMSSPAMDPALAPSELPEPARDVIGPAPAPEPLPAIPPTLTIVTPPTTAWYLVHTKPWQEDVALTNLPHQTAGQRGRQELHRPPRARNPEPPGAGGEHRQHGGGSAAATGGRSLNPSTPEKYFL